MSRMARLSEEERRHRKRLLREYAHEQRERDGDVRRARTGQAELNASLGGLLTISVTTGLMYEFVDMKEAPWWMPLIAFGGCILAGLAVTSALGPRHRDNSD